MLDLSAVRHVMRNDIRLLFRDRGSVFWSFIGPILFMYALGSIFGGKATTDRTLLFVQNQDSGTSLVRALDMLLEDDGVDVHLVPADSIVDPKDFLLVIVAGAADSLAVERPPRFVLHTPNVDPTPREQTLRAQVIRATLSAFLGLTAADAHAALDTATVRAHIAFEPRVALARHAVAAPEISSGLQRTVPAYLIMFVMMTALTAGAEILIAERRSGLLRRALVSSLAPGALVAGKFLSRFLFAWIQIAILLSVGIFVFHIAFGSHPMALFVALTCFALCATGIGVLFATLFEHPDKASGVGILLTLAMASLGGCWWPLEIVSSAMQKIAWFLPTGWGFDALNRVMALDSGLGPLRPHLTYLLGVAAVTVPLAAWRLSRSR